MTVDPGWVALSLLRHVGGKTMRRLLNEFGTVDAILAADAQALQRVKGVGPKIAAAIEMVDVTSIAQQLEQWSAANVYTIPASTITYPERLHHLDDEPATLFMRGTMVVPSLWGRTVAVVGTRQPTPVAAELALHIGAKLSENGVTVVSGMALGIDAQAHRGALSMSQGVTLGVLGGGVLNIYPPQHTELAERVMQQGVLLSENHPHATASAVRLVARNRIISGLCDMLVVVETRADGGAMYAARAAKAQGKTIFTPSLPADGNQALLRDGATALSSDLSELLRQLT